MKPEISVIIPFYNSEQTLARAIDSVINQSFSGWELMLVNDGSTDLSEEIAKIFLSDSRIHYFSQVNWGVSAARNQGAKLASGNWLIFLDSDDELSPDALSFFFQTSEDFPDVDLLFGGYQISSAGRVTIVVPESGKYFSKLPGTFLIRKEFFMRLGGYDEELKFAENTELFHRFNLAGGIETLIPFVTHFHSENLNGGSKNLQNMIDSLNHFLKKHKETLSLHENYLYHQIIGVNHMRFQNYTLARVHLWVAYRLKPLKLKTFGRLVISYIPPLAKMLYPKKITY